MARRRRACRRLRLAVAILAIGLPAAARAATFTWSPSGHAGGEWTDPANWGQAPLLPDAPDAIAVLSDGITANSTVTVAHAVTVGSLTIGATHAYTLSGSALNFDATAGPAQLLFPALSGAVAQTINCPLILHDDLTATVEASQTLTLGGAISGAYQLAKTGSGTLQLSSAASTLGAVSIQAGTLAIVTNNQSFTSLSMAQGTLATGLKQAIVSGGITYTGASNTATITGSLNLSGGDQVFDAADGAAASDLTVSATLTHAAAGQLIKRGAGALLLSGNNSALASPIVIEAGTLGISAANNLGTAAGGVTIGNAALLLHANNITVADTLTLADPASTVTVEGSYSGSLSTLTGLGSGALNKRGTGTLTLTGTASYTGGTVVSEGTLKLDSAARVNSRSVRVDAGATLNATADFDAGSLLDPASAGLLSYSTATLTTLTGVNGSSVFLGTTTTTSFTGLTLAPGAGNTYRLGGSTGTLTLTAANVLSGPNDVLIGGNVTFSSPQTFSGNLTVNTGTLRLNGPLPYAGLATVHAGAKIIAGVDNALPATSVLTVDSGATFDFAGYDLTVAGLSGDGNFTSATAGVAFRINGPGACGGYIKCTGTVSGMTFEKSGPGTLILTATSTFASTGGVRASGGTLEIGANNAFAPANNLTLDAGATLDLHGWNQSAVTVTGAGAVTNLDPAFAGLFTVTGPGSALDGPLSGRLDLTVDGSSASLALHSPASTFAGAISVTHGAILTLTTDAALGDPANPLYLGAGISSNQGFLSAPATFTLGPGHALYCNNLSTTAAVSTGSLSNLLTIAGPVHGQNFTIADGSHVRLSGVCDYAGPTTIGLGVSGPGAILELGATNALPLATTLAFKAAYGYEAVFDLNGFDQTLAALSSATGTNQGSLITSSSPTLSRLTVDSPSAVSFGGRIAGNLALVKRGAGTLTLAAGPVTAPNTFTGPLTVAAGELDLAKPAGVTAVSGPLILDDGTAAQPCIARLLAAEQIAPAAPVTLGPQGLLDLNGFTQTLGGLAVAGGRVATGAGTLILAGDVAATWAGGAPARLEGKVDLGAATRTFNVTPGPFAGPLGPPDLVVTATVSNGALTKSGDGAMVLAAAWSSTVPIAVEAGRLVLAASLSGASPVSVTGPGAVADFAVTQSLPLLNLAAGATARLLPVTDPTYPGPKTLLLNDLTVAGAATPTATLDLADGALILRRTPDRAPSLLADLIALLHSGAADQTWSGPGLTSSTAAADPARATAIGLLPNAAPDAPRTPLYSTFAGQPVAATDLLLAYTWYGDTNLDGHVDAADLSTLAAHYRQPGSWWQGDFNYDGQINILDLALLTANLGKTSFPPPLPIPGAGEGWGEGTSAVGASTAPQTIPEPTSLAVLLLAALSSGATGRPRPRGLPVH